MILLPVYCRACYVSPAATAHSAAPVHPLSTGPAGLLGAAEGGSWLAVAAGLVVLALQVQTRGYVPSALPDSNCFGPGAPERQQSALAPPSPSEIPALLKEGLTSLKDKVP